MNNPARPEAVQEAMNRAVELNATYEFQRELKGIFTEKNDKELLVDLAAYVRELEAKIVQFEKIFSTGCQTDSEQCPIAAERDRLKVEHDKIIMEVGRVNDALHIIDLCQVVPLVESYKAELAEARKGRG